MLIQSLQNGGGSRFEERISKIFLLLPLQLPQLDDFLLALCLALKATQCKLTNPESQKHISDFQRNPVAPQESAKAPLPPAFLNFLAEVHCRKPWLRHKCRLV